MTYTQFTASHVDAAALLEQYAPDPWTSAQIAEELLCSAAQLFAAIDENGELCGFCAFQASAGEATLNAITIAPAHRENGYATALLQYAFACLPAKEVFLEVRSANKSAIALYSKLGFKQNNMRWGFYKNPTDDAIVMNLTINEGIC